MGDGRACRARSGSKRSTLDPATFRLRSEELDLGLQAALRRGRRRPRQSLRNCSATGPGRGATRQRREGPPTRRRARCVPSSSIRPSVLRGCVRAPPRVPRTGQGVRPPAARADAVRGPRSRRWRLDEQHHGVARRPKPRCRVGDPRVAACIRTHPGSAPLPQRARGAARHAESRWPDRHRRRPRLHRDHEWTAPTPPPAGGGRRRAVGPGGMARAARRVISSGINGGIGRNRSRTSCREGVTFSRTGAVRPAGTPCRPGRLSPEAAL